MKNIILANSTLRALKHLYIGIKPKVYFGFKDLRFTQLYAFS